MILNHGSLPGAFDIHFRRVKCAAARGRGPPQQASALPFLRFADPSDSVRLSVAGGPYAHCLLLVDAPGNRGAQCYAPVCVLLLCLIASGQIPGICLCHWATELARTNSKSRSRAPLFPTSSANAATKLQVSSTVRKAAGLLGLALETLTGACRYSSHTFEGHGSHVPRILWYGRMEDPAGRPTGFLCCLGYVRLSPLAQSLSLEASLGRDLQAVQKQTLAAVAGATLASGDSNSLQALIGNTAFLRGRGITNTVSP